MTLRLRPGETHALLGENGTGKSTLVKRVLRALATGDSAGLDAALDRRRHPVTVNGMVTGGAHSDPEMRDAAVHPVGGGRLTVGETGVLVTGAGRPAILVNDPGRSEIVIHGEVKGNAG